MPHSGMMVGMVRLFFISVFISMQILVLIKGAKLLFFANL